jgi:hypothetical protein
MFEIDFGEILELKEALEGVNVEVVYTVDVLWVALHILDGDLQCFQLDGGEGLWQLSAEILHIFTIRQSQRLELEMGRRELQVVDEQLGLDKRTCVNGERS